MHSVNCQNQQRQSFFPLSVDRKTSDSLGFHDTESEDRRKKERKKERTKERERERERERAREREREASNPHPKNEIPLLLIANDIFKMRSKIFFLLN